MELMGIVSQIQAFHKCINRTNGILVDIVGQTLRKKCCLCLLFALVLAQ
jgi:hypothetical protein